MIRLKIVNKNSYNYECKDEKDNCYNINLEFLDIEEVPKVRRLYMDVRRIII